MSAGRKQQKPITDTRSLQVISLRRGKQSPLRTAVSVITTMCFGPGPSPGQASDMGRLTGAFFYGALILIAAIIPPLLLILDLLRH
jgi:hypothetical protein